MNSGPNAIGPTSARIVKSLRGAWRRLRRGLLRNVWATQASRWLFQFIPQYITISNDRAQGRRGFRGGEFLFGLPRDTYFMVCYTKSPKDGCRIAALGRSRRRSREARSEPLPRSRAACRRRRSPSDAEGASAGRSRTLRMAWHRRRFQEELLCRNKAEISDWRA